MSREIFIPVPQRDIDPCLFPPFYETVPLPNGFQRNVLTHTYYKAQKIAEETDGEIGNLFAELLYSPELFSLFLSLLKQPQDPEYEIAGELFEQLAARYVITHSTELFGSDAIIIPPNTTRDIYKERIGYRTADNPYLPSFSGIKGFAMTDGFVIIRSKGSTWNMTHYLEYTACNNTIVIDKCKKRSNSVKKHFKDKSRLYLELPYHGRSILIEVEENLSPVIVIPSNSELIKSQEFKMCHPRDLYESDVFSNDYTDMQFKQVPITRSELKHLTGALCQQIKY